MCSYSQKVLYSIGKAILISWNILFHSTWISIYYSITYTDLLSRQNNIFKEHVTFFFFQVHTHIWGDLYEKKLCMSQ